MKKQRNTVQRQIILEAVRKSHTHPTVEEVSAQIHKNHPTISKATIYRNLRLLSECGEIRQVSLPDDVDRFDGRTGQHYHFRCKICGSLFDVDVAYLGGINETVQQKYGFQVDEHDVVFRGVCAACRIDK
ncbi:MAG: transcriptional repressor [Desulfobulbus sp.]|nr:transcriptional repressor [Desulfobulbus sp.]